MFDEHTTICFASPVSILLFLEMIFYFFSEWGKDFGFFSSGNYIFSSLLSSSFSLLPISACTLLDLRCLQSSQNIVAPGERPK